MTQTIARQKQKCTVIGILEDGEKSLNQTAINILQNADVLIGSPRFMATIRHLLKDTAEKKDFSGNILNVPRWVQTALDENKQVVVLATGDPLCHGIGSYLVKKLGIEQCHFIPNISMFQLAFARLGLAWQNIKICSVHSKDMGDWSAAAPYDHGMRPLLRACHKHDLIVVYTSPENSPKRIAKMLEIETLGDQFEMIIASALGTENEKTSDWLSMEQAQSYVYDEPNLVILKRSNKTEKPVLMGVYDDQYEQRMAGNKGLITKQEIRAVSLAKMQLRHDSIVWDIGAGSGSIGLECAQLCADGYVYAIEKNQADYDIVLKNKYASAVLPTPGNYHIELGKAPQGLENWQDPDAIFIGGSGGNLAELILLCLQRLKVGGRLVMNFITLENLQTACDTLKNIENIEWNYIQMHISRSKPILKMHRLEAENPVFIVTASTLIEKQQVSK